MRPLFGLVLFTALVLGPSAPANAAKLHNRAMQNFRGAHGAVIHAPDGDVSPGWYRGRGSGFPRQNNLDPSTWGTG
jgi:hypothetical protein